MSEEQAGLFGVCDVCGGMGGEHREVTTHSGVGDTSTHRCPCAPLSDLDEKHIGGFRRDAMATSRQAAIDQYKGMTAKKHRVIAAFVEAGARGLTHSELTDRLSPHDPGTSTWRARASELEEGGWLMDSGYQRRTPRGKPTTVWILTDAAKAELASRQVAAAE